MAARSLKQLAAEARRAVLDETPDLRGDELALAIGDELATDHRALSFTTQGRADAAARAAGVATPTEIESEVADLDAARVQRRRRVSTRARGAGRRALRAPTSPFGRGRSAASLIRQSFGLVVLYWLLSTPGAVARLRSGILRVFVWLDSPYRGVPAGTIDGPTLPGPGGGGRVKTV